MYSFFVRPGTALAAVLVLAACSKDLATGPLSPVTTVTAVSPFHPDAPMSLSAGTYDWTDVVIPAGVTVNVTGDVVLRVAGDAMIQGKIVGDCVGVKLVAEGKLTLRGSVENACSHGPPATGTPGMRLIARGGYVVDGGGAKTSGDFEITNDTTVTEESLTKSATSMSATASTSIAPKHASFSRQPDTGVSCLFVTGNFPANPSRQPDGTSGANGTDGIDGHTWIAACSDDMAVTGIFRVTSQSGGDGGDGTQIGATPTVHAGKGGAGGKLKLLVNGVLWFDPGSNTRLQSGDGGIGGDATATSTVPGNRATAVAGPGGDPGMILVHAADGIEARAAVTLQIGRGGNGGDAKATALNGAGCSSLNGGDAIATGGAGGSTPNKTMKIEGTNGVNQISVTGGVPGIGGDATTVAGNGADGQMGCSDGGKGGAHQTTAGNGGDALLIINNLPLSTGGKGGDAVMTGGSGGTGLNACASLTPGGNGGDGGAAFGAAGSGGARGGTNGTRTITGVGNGGNGGGGRDPGKGGAKGAGPGVAGPVTRSYNPGTDGSDCDFAAVYGTTVGPPANDVGGDEKFFAVMSNHQIVVTKTGTGAAQQFTIIGLRVCGILIPLAATGVTAYTRAGDFSVQGTGAINLGPPRGLQPIVVKMTGKITSTGMLVPATTIEFTISVESAPNATAKFGPVTYKGSGLQMNPKS